MSSSSNATIVSSIQNEINTINSVIVILSRWAIPSIILVGSISNILSIYIFTRPALKRNPCCMYFLSSATTALIYTVLNLPLRALQYGYRIDPTLYSLALCKIKYLFSYTWKALTIWFLLLATVDRFLHSSANANLRRWSSVKVASRAIPLTFLLVHLGYLHVPIFYGILPPNRACSVENTRYELFLGVWHLLTYGTGPPLLMLIFSLLTIRHVHRRRIIPVPTNQSNQDNRNSSKDRNLIRMALAQSLIVGSTTTIYAVSQYYTTLTSSEVKGALQLTRENLFYVLTGILAGVGHNATFFVFTLSSQLFRQQLLRRRSD